MGGGGGKGTDTPWGGPKITQLAYQVVPGYSKTLIFGWYFVFTLLAIKRKITKIWYREIQF